VCSTYLQKWFMFPTRRFHMAKNMHLGHQRLSLAFVVSFTRSSLLQIAHNQGMPPSLRFSKIAFKTCRSCDYAISCSHPTFSIFLHHHSIHASSLLCLFSLFRHLHFTCVPPQRPQGKNIPVLGIGNATVPIEHPRDPFLRPVPVFLLSFH